jgi:hypothetical protein
VIVPIDYGARIERQRCRACWNADGFDFHVPDAVWEAVVPEALRSTVVCLRCFDDLAAEKGIDYLDQLAPALYFAGERVCLILRIDQRATCSCR